jgi:hypothetical protein
LMKPGPDTVAAVHRFLWQTLPYYGIGGLGWLGCAAYESWMYRRWGRVPRVLTTDAEGLAYSRLGWMRIRERKWPASELTGIELRLTKDESQLEADCRRSLHPSSRSVALALSIVFIGSQVCRASSPNAWRSRSVVPYPDPDSAQNSRNSSVMMPHCSSSRAPWSSGNW